jgi:hypothetical protein
MGDQQKESRVEIGLRLTQQPDGTNQVPGAVLETALPRIWP